MGVPSFLFQVVVARKARDMPHPTPPGYFRFCKVNFKAISKSIFL